MKLFFGIVSILAAAYFLLRPELGYKIFKLKKNPDDPPSYSYRVTAGIAGIALLLLGLLLIVNHFAV